jgi:hypothetical protein
VPTPLWLAVTPVPFSTAANENKNDTDRNIERELSIVESLFDVTSDAAV